MSVNISVDLLRKIIREEVRRAFLEIFLELIPYVNDKEQEEIELVAGKPEDYREEDFVEWSGE